eukprot:2401111-Amphidinium_carterae.2
MLAYKGWQGQGEREIVFQRELECEIKMLHAKRRSREAAQSGTERVADQTNMHIAKKEQENMIQRESLHGCLRVTHEQL